ncbi:MAG: type II toxin-antitoxin system VapC family toxin [Thermoanaerobaculia bacterium]
MVLVDTSVWVDVFRDTTGRRASRLRKAVAEEEIVLARFNQLELLQGCRDEREWGLLHSYLEDQEYLEMRPDSWQDAARLYFDLRRNGRTVRSPIDCCIAQLAMDYNALLLHRDVDFETIAKSRPLRQLRMAW